MGQILAGRRKDLRWTQEDVARKLSTRLGEPINRNYVSSAEIGQLVPSVDRATALADVLEMAQPERLMLMKELGAGDLGYTGLDLERTREGEEFLGLFEELRSKDRRRIVRLMRLWLEEGEAE